MKKFLSVIVLVFMVVVLGATNTSFAVENQTGADKDLCSNMEGVQAEIPAGYFAADKDCFVFNENGMPKVQQIVTDEIVVVYDFCSNYSGVQKSLPPGFKRLEGSSTCTPINPPANSDSICPVGSFPRDNGECALDVCFNLRGAQSEIPKDYEMKTPGQCTAKPKPAPVVVDMCLNITGNQSKIPTGFTVYKNNCYRTNDMCWNIPETQLVVPTGYKAIDRTCLLVAPK